MRPACSLPECCPPTGELGPPRESPLVVPPVPPVPLVPAPGQWPWADHIVCLWPPRACTGRDPSAGAGAGPFPRVTRSCAFLGSVPSAGESVAAVAVRRAAVWVPVESLTPAASSAFSVPVAEVPASGDGLPESVVWSATASGMSGPDAGFVPSPDGSSPAPTWPESIGVVVWTVTAVSGASIVVVTTRRESVPVCETARPVSEGACAGVPGAVPDWGAVRPRLPRSALRVAAGGSTLISRAAAVLRGMGAKSAAVSVFGAESFELLRSVPIPSMSWGVSPSRAAEENALGPVSPEPALEPPESARCAEVPLFPERLARADPCPASTSAPAKAVRSAGAPGALGRGSAGWPADEVTEGLPNSTDRAEGVTGF